MTQNEYTRNPKSNPILEGGFHCHICNAELSYQNTDLVPASHLNPSMGGFLCNTCHKDSITRRLHDFAIQNNRQDLISPRKPLKEILSVLPPQPQPMGATVMEEIVQSQKPPLRERPMQTSTKHLLSRPLNGGLAKTPLMMMDPQGVAGVFLKVLEETSTIPTPVVDSIRIAYKQQNANSSGLVALAMMDMGRREKEVEFYENLSRIYISRQEMNRLKRTPSWTELIRMSPSDHLRAYILTVVPEWS